MFHNTITCLYSRLLQSIYGIILGSCLLFLGACANSTANSAGLYQGFIADADGVYHIYILALYEDGTFVQSVQSPSNVDLPLQIETGSWTVADNTVVLSRDGLKDQRWKKNRRSLILSGVQQQFEHWKLWRID